MKADYRGNFEFRVTGKLGEKSVELKQQMILNVSKLGTLYNQWPSRIYVNGKTVSEAEFKAGLVPIWELRSPRPTRIIKYDA